MVRIFWVDLETETFSCMEVEGRFFFIDSEGAVQEAMCWCHHDSDISDPAPKDGFDEADVVTLTHQPIDIRGIPSGLLFSAGLARHLGISKFLSFVFIGLRRAMVTYYHVGELFSLPLFFPDMTIDAGRALTEQDIIPQHTTSPLSSDEPIPGKTDSQQRVEGSDPKIVATRIRKAQAAAKRKTDKNRGSEGASGPERGSKRRKEKVTDHIPVYSSSDYRGDGNFDDDVDEEVNLEGPERHVNDTTERVILVLTTLRYPGVQEEMHLLDNNIVLDRAWFTLARGAMAQAHALRQFESLYDTHHALKGDLETTRSHLVRSREDFNVVQNFYNTLSERHRKLREEHDQCSEHLAVVQAEKDGLMTTNAEQALRIKELEQQLKSADEVHSSAVKDLESQLAQKDSALVYAERVSSDRLSENEELRTQLAFAKREKIDAVKKLLPTVSVQDLLKLHPAPPPKDAPKAGSGGVAFAPKLVRAAEVAGSKDTASREISKSKTGPSLQDPDRASGGSKAPPSKKT
ncbi:hypothetical protein Tco_0952988 [Tanacetum coccineum]|uniref:Uncharacterized protein n=1 Tax=Tanacetum coccineum TaxID=301880 RepID=A0ABQ5DZ18_9ASTR